MYLYSNSKDGDSPLHIACTKQNYNIIELLLIRNANPNLMNNSYRTPVHYAILHFVNNPGMIYLLVQCGGSLVMKDQQNNRPLDYIQNDELRKAIDILKINNESVFMISMESHENENIKINIENKINHQIYKIDQVKTDNLTFSSKNHSLGYSCHNPLETQKYIL